ncbi:unnamed protein product, partial [Tilletia laevis]
MKAALKQFPSDVARSLEMLVL